MSIAPASAGSRHARVRRPRVSMHGHPYPYCAAECSHTYNTQQHSSKVPLFYFYSFTNASVQTSLTVLSKGLFIYFDHKFLASENKVMQTLKITAETSCWKKIKVNEEVLHWSLVTRELLVHGLFFFPTLFFVKLLKTNQGRG